MTRIIGFALLFVITSCATGPYQPYAREIKKKPGVEGVISLKPSYVPEDRTYADTIMNKNCGTKPVNVIEEGEVGVGTATTSNSAARDDKETNGFNVGGFKYLTGGTTDVKNTATSSHTTTVKEWQISYNCVTEVAQATSPKVKLKKK